MLDYYTYLNKILDVMSDYYTYEDFHFLRGLIEAFYNNSSGKNIFDYMIEKLRK